MAGYSTDSRADRGTDSEWSTDEAPTAAEGFKSPAMRSAVRQLNHRRSSVKKKAEEILCLLLKKNSEPPEADVEEDRASQLPKITVPK